MTPSTTNTAAREVANVLVRADHIERMELVGRQCIDGAKCHHGCLKSCSRRTSCVPLSIADSYLRDDWTLIATQQQGGEQEAGGVEQQARELLAAECERDGGLDAAKEIRVGYLTGHERRAIRAITAALRTKQPAASEGDGRAMLRECYEWLFESKADGPQVSEGAIERGYYTPEFRDLHDRLRATIDNTSKQAAGEAVAWAIRDHLGGLVELTASQQRCEQMMATNGGGRPTWTAEPLYTTPPRHPADEGAVDDSMVERAARIVAELAGEDFDLIGGFAQGILLDTQRAALTAALQPGSTK